jgi:hypothetical protein
MQRPGMRAVRLVDENKDLLALVENRKLVRTILMASFSLPTACLSLSWYFWSTAKTMSGVRSASTRCVSPVADSRVRVSMSVGRTASPLSAAVSRSWASRSVRSVTTTTLNFLSLSNVRILRTRNTMLRLLPDP